MEEMKRMAERQSPSLNFQELDQKISLLDKKLTRILEIIMSK
ncbi:MAG: hypothetical protein WBH76_08120 [Dictyoglomaceae bacterium]|nr:hypothetical protein [Dictyoglomaceae bacterium]